MYKILNCVYDETLTEGMFTVNEQNPCKLIKKSRTCLRSIFFTIAVINDWNSLPESVIFGVCINLFELRLDKHWANNMYQKFFAEDESDVHRRN